MPLKHGNSRYVVGSNIKELESSGRPRKQSIAIALSEASKDGDSGSGSGSKRKHGGKSNTNTRYRDGARLSNLKMPHVIMDVE